MFPRHRTTVLLAAALLAITALPAAAAERRPNILLIITDQQRFDMLSSAGNPWLKTPNMDRLAAAGTRFDRAYCAFPLCSPSRFSMFSGVMPSRIGLETNDVVPVPQDVLDNAMGSVLGRAGYETVYAGKTHLPSPKRSQSIDYGFQRNLTPDSRDTLAARCAEYLRQKHDRPFLLVASFINPHDICSMGMRAFAESGLNKKKGAAKSEPEALACLDRAVARPAGISDEEFFTKLCPPMPANCEESPDLAGVLGFTGGMIDFEQTKWTDRDWQMHRWAYARLTEQVDAQVGIVLDALRKAGLEKDTLVVFTSDHGEMDASHRLGHKQFLYEEAVRVPLIVAWPGHTRAGAVDREHLVSTGLDLIPTLCEFAGTPVPPALKGRSVAPLAEGRPVADWRKEVVIENRSGRAYRAETWKYVAYNRKGQEPKEAVIDLAKDPGEMHNSIGDPDGPKRLEEGRNLLQQWYRQHGETLEASYRITTSPPPRGYTIATIDLALQGERQVIVDREPGQYLGHVTTVLLEDGRTIIAVYPKGHGRGAIVMKRSEDGGLTWSDRLPTPASWATSQEVPTIYRVVDPSGVKRLIMFSGLYPIRMAVSADDGRKWSELKPIGDFGGIVAMADLVHLKDGRYMALFHDDGRFLHKDGKKTNQFRVYKTVSGDGGLTWGKPAVIAYHPDAHLCEPGAVRSPDGRQIAVLLRENSRKHNGFVIFSDDEGRTWTKPRELPGALTGDRHTCRYAPDGRLVITFRDTTLESPTKGDWVAWVGRYEDIAAGKEGQYRVRLMDNRKGADCAYPGMVVLPDGTFVTTTYGHWIEGQMPFIVSVRFKLEEIDRLASP